MVDSRCTRMVNKTPLSQGSGVFSFLQLPFRGMDDRDCIDCEAKRDECEQRCQRWIRNLCMLDEQLRFLLNVVDHHRKRNKRLAYVEQIRGRLRWLIDQLK